METKVSKKIMKKLLLLIFIFTSFSAFSVEKKTNFSTVIFESAQGSGKTIVVNSYETWCGTCSIQVKILDQAEKEFKDIIFLSYEQSKNKNIAKKLAIDFGQLSLFIKEMTRLLASSVKLIKKLFIQP